jgi:hypothetical protein
MPGQSPQVVDFAVTETVAAMAVTAVIAKSDCCFTLRDRSIFALARGAMVEFLAMVHRCGAPELVLGLSFVCNK